MKRMSLSQWNRPLRHAKYCLAAATASWALLGCAMNSSPSSGAAPGPVSSAGANAMGSAGATGLGTGGSSGAADSAPTNTNLDSDPPGDPKAAGVMPLRYMTSREYLSTVADLLGDTSLVETDVPTEATSPTFDYFPFRTPGTVGNAEAEALQYAAEKVSANVVANLSKILPCMPTSATAEAACATQFINSFGPKAYRRPLDAGEATRLNTLYQTARTTLSLNFNDAIALLVEAILQSPGFYYHWQQPAAVKTADANGKIPLDPYTLATRLSYFLWGTMPDQPLFDAAAQNKLATEADVEAQARRMLTGPKARAMASDFVVDLLDMDMLGARPKSTDRYAVYPSLEGPMLTEIQNFAAAILIDGSGTLADLLTSTATTVNQPLAAFYGLSNVTGMAFQAAKLNPAQRGGVLTLAGFMANTGNEVGSLPPRRGKVVYSRLLCTELPPPPNGVPEVTPEQANVTTRQRFEQHSMNPCAKACHQILDGIGFAFEHYDGIGAYRDTDSGVAVNSQTSYSLDNTPLTFANALELEAALAKSDSVRSCMTRQWLRYAFRRMETAADTASLQAANQQFKASGNNMRELIVSLVKSRTFRFRSPAVGEAL